MDAYSFSGSTPCSYICLSRLAISERASFARAMRARYSSSETSYWEYHIGSDGSGLFVGKLEWDHDGGVELCLVFYGFYQQLLHRWLGQPRTFCSLFRPLLNELMDESMDVVLECIFGLSIMESNDMRLVCVCGDIFLFHGRPW